jgi:cytochrome o ubiquinol oxidase operon protein cyoD
MSKEENTHQAEHHGTVASYVTGFVLSLVFTLIPYYLVVHKSFDKKVLSATILGFGVLQMMVQMMFFLHLGREKKPHWNLFFLASTVSIILLVVVGSLWIMSHLTHSMSAVNVTDKIVTDEAIYQVDGVQAGTCPEGTGKRYEIVFMNNVATPSHVDAHLCDTLIFMNHDSTTRQIEFGTPGEPAPYAGKNSMAAYGHHDTVVRLTELGVHKFYDQKLTQLSGDFTVTR